MYQVELLVSLKIPDVTALTAANTLRRRLGYEGILVKLSRADCYLFDLVAESQAQACQTVRHIAEHTNLFVNPNKHVFEIRPWQPRSTLPKRDDVYEVACLVRSLDYDPGSTLVDSLRRMGYDAVHALKTGTLWTLHLRVDSEAAARQIAEDIAVTQSRSRGLLVNPHYQTSEVF
jgi:phosphoribosylformylglycinamidine (FGAM) synthase PurS component